MGSATNIFSFIASGVLRVFVFLWSIWHSFSGVEGVLQYLGFDEASCENQ